MWHIKTALNTNGGYQILDHSDPFLNLFQHYNLSRTQSGDTINHGTKARHLNVPKWGQNLRMIGDIAGDGTVRGSIWQVNEKHHNWRLRTVNQRKTNWAAAVSPVTMTTTVSTGNRCCILLYRTLSRDIRSPWQLLLATTRHVVRELVLVLDCRRGGVMCSWPRWGSDS